MIKLRLFLFFFYSLLLLPASVFSQEKIWEKHNNGITEYLVYYSLENTHILELYEKKTDKLQTKVWRKVFSSPTKVFATITQLDFSQEQKIKNPSQTDLKFHVTEALESVIWPVTQQWNMEWESRYANWIESEVNSDYFIEHQFATDCADVALALRWIFARDNGLPAGNKLAGSGNLFTQSSVKMNG